MCGAAQRKGRKILNVHNSHVCDEPVYAAVTHYYMHEGICHTQSATHRHTILHCIAHIDYAGLTKCQATRQMRTHTGTHCAHARTNTRPVRQSVRQTDRHTQPTGNYYIDKMENLSLLYKCNARCQPTLMSEKTIVFHRTAAEKCSATIYYHSTCTSM